MASRDGDTGAQGELTQQANEMLHTTRAQRIAYWAERVPSAAERPGTPPAPVRTAHAVTRDVVIRR